MVIRVRDRSMRWFALSSRGVGQALSASPGWSDTRNQKEIACPRAGDVKNLAFRGLDFFEVRIIGDRFDSCLEWNHLVVTSHNHYGAKFQTLGPGASCRSRSAR